MNSKFLKKVVLSCLVLGAVNYGNIGNTMEDIPENAENQDVNNYIKFENNHYIGEVNGEKIDISASEFGLKEFETEELGNDADVTMAANSLVKMLQKNLNHMIEGRLNIAYKAYEIYTANKKLMDSEIGDIIGECLRESAAKSNCEFDKETLARSVENIATKYSELIKAVKENKYGSNKENEKIFESYYDIIQQISDDFKIARLYDKANGGEYNFVKNFILKDNDVKEDNGRIENDEDFLRKIGILDDDEVLNYKEASTLMKLILKYVSQDICNAVAEGFGGKYTIDDGQVIEFKQKFEDLKKWSAFIIEKEELIQFFNGCQDVEDEVNKLAKSKKRERINQKSKAFLQHKEGWKDIKVDDQSMYMNVTKGISNRFRNLALQQQINDNMKQDVKKEEDNNKPKQGKKKRNKNGRKLVEIAEMIDNIEKKEQNNIIEKEEQNNIIEKEEQNNTIKEEEQNNTIKEEEQQKPDENDDNQMKKDDVIDINADLLNQTVNELIKNNNG